MTNYLGSLSEKYESGNSGPGTIANNPGDIGGASYGTYQIAAKTGTMTTFLKFLKSDNLSFYQVLSKHTPGTSPFDAVWRDLAKKYPDKFSEVQHNFIKSTHYDPAVRKIKDAIGIDINKCSLAVKNVVWSTAVQHGSGGATNVFRGAGINPGMNEEDIIRNVYAERSANNGKKYFTRSSDSIRKSVINRFNRELEDALKMLGQVANASVGDTKLYRLVTGDLGNKANLTAGKKRLQDKYSWIIYEKVETDFRLVTGTFKSKEIAESHADNLRKEFGWTVYVQEV